MATFRNRHGKWQARVLRKGFAPISKSFTTRQDAERWARQIETEMDQGRFASPVEAERTTFGELIGRYMLEVTPTMRGAKDDLIRLKALQRNALCKLSMVALTPSKVAEYRDQRLKQVSSGTVIRELAYISSIVNQARREWGINIDNPVRLVRKPPSPQGRDRILNEAEKVRILDALTPRPTRRVSSWMQAEINSYRADSDLLGEFLEDQTCQAKDGKAEQKELYTNYKYWCENNGVRPQSKKSLTQRLKERGYPDGKSGSSRFYIGLKLIDAFGQKYGQN